MGIVWLGLLLLVLSQVTLEQNEPLSSVEERESLLELRGSLGLRSKEWPRKPDPCLIWVGITCQNGRVVGINISGFRRTRLGRRNPQFAVDALANFTLLRSFNASNFPLPGSIPDWFGLSLPSLTVLDLRSCSIVDAIPSTLGNLTNLTSLYLSDNNLIGNVPGTLGQLLALSVLDLSRNSLTGSIPASFAFLGNLSSLDMSANFLSGAIPTGIGTLSRLQYLNLSNNGLSSLPAELGGLASLVDLDLSENSFVGGGLPPDFTRLRNLRRMILANSMLTGALPGRLFSDSLQFLVLRQNNFSGSLPVELWSLPRLSFLDVSANNFSGLLPNSTSAANNATAAVLNISHNKFYGGLTPALRRFGFVDLSSNYFEGKILDYMLNVSLDINCLQKATNQRSTMECASFYAERGLSFDNFGQPNTTKPPTAESSGKSNKTKIILAAVFGGVGLIALLVLLLVLLLLCARKRGNSNQRGNGVGPAPVGSSPPNPGVLVDFPNVGDSFTYHQLLQATGDFNDANLIKHGHTGDFFNGVLESGIPVVIKRIDMRSTKKEAYLSELDFFNKVSHQRFVPLLGHCLENENEKFLVYKRMTNGDLSNCLYYKNTSEDGTLQSLDWITRLKIATGAAEALSYLHHECVPPIVHRDIQASSILLDDKYEVRLGSLSESCAQEGDIHQSKITRFLRLPQSSEQGTSGSSTSICVYDVYCFGKVLLELVTGKLGMSAASDTEVKEWFDQILPCISMYDKELVTKIVDPSMVVDEDFLEEVWAISIVARSCLNPKPSRRPPMRYVLKALENPLKVVREENSSSARLRATSSRGSWNATLFGSWRQSSSDVTLTPAASGTKLERASSLKLSGTTGSQSQGSFHNGGEILSSRRRHSKEILPEPSGVHDVERLELE
ncbi:hypothetical protein AAZX31_06G012100 [Glycine max]|uniref:Putative LRR receptor-like serine/threonine-protein kinase isoform A n=1 Tax=Glycine soja TaxID=3848 RepID=A0A445K346_GLYSO|nr:probable LRR receptor-like serine/threonine-protein kinase At2g16250 [Glycine soja]KAG5044686.1 hypothetical protein JHK86_014092 [Glycine max]KAG5018114.1 hypothetical protein JHK87_013969 [Glycine soja]KAH1244111.1 putative LRR receptor-like serine/threonine-protein kinase [Glycine max]RZC05234.1 putative LRR receptor-like serine/threonine-protein kinase isoform A [Glycine soja]RZC05235.1 putative LRR receptor-like serine/threonine-protein kinase isoform B [Glycine soja]